MIKVPGTRAILFQIEMAGNGVVITDSSDQKWILKGHPMNGDQFVDYYDNTLYTKNRPIIVGRDEEGRPVYDRKIYISSDCLRHNIFSDDFQHQTPNAFHSRVVFNKMIATPASLLRGYLFPSGETSLKRASTFTVTEALQSNDAVTTIETCSRSGAKVSQEDNGGTADSSFFKR